MYAARRTRSDPHTIDCHRGVLNEPCRAIAPGDNRERPITQGLTAVDPE